MKLRAAIFDLDGTLADTLTDIATTLNAVLTSMGLPTHPAEAYKGFVGAGIATAAERALAREHLPRRDEVVSRFRELYGQHLLDTSRPYEGIPALLDALDARRAPMSVLSNKPHEPTRVITDALFGKRRFRAVYGQRDGVPKKPDPTVALELAGMMGVEPDECVFVGDTLIDMETARQAGMVGVGVLWGFRPREELVDHGASAIIATPAELLAVLDKGEHSDPWL